MISAAFFLLCLRTSLISSQHKKLYFVFSVNYQYSTKDRAKNANVALAIIVLMSTGVAMRFMWIW